MNVASMDAPLAVLQWDRGVLEAECERGPAVQAGVEAYLGRAVFAPEGSVVIRVKLTRSQENNRAPVVARVTQETNDGRAWGEREVEGDSSCASLDEPLTLVVALLVDAPTSQPEPTTSEVAAVPAAPSPSRAPDETETTEREPGDIETAPSLQQAQATPGHAVFLASGLVSMGGVLPSTAGGASLLASLKLRGFWALGLEVGAAWPQDIPLGAGSLETSLFTLSGNICPLQGLADRTWWSACGSVGAGRLHAQSHQVLEPQSRSDWFFLPGAAVRGGWLVGGDVLISAGLQALFPVSPDHYVYRSTEGEKVLAFEPTPLMISAQFGVGLILR